MALHIVRFQQAENIKWGILEDDLVYALGIPCATTRSLLEIDRDQLHLAAKTKQKAIKANEVELLSPITKPAKVLCQGANYRQHMIDSGMNPDDKRFNMFFTKSSASINTPTGKIIRPRHVQLLDYEIELALVLGKKTTSTVHIDENNLHEFVAGITIGNDVTARDIQIPETQFHKGKSYRTFCPLGPVLCLLDRNEMHYLDNLQLRLSVNGEARQMDSTANLVYKPAATLTEFSQIHDFEPGDVLMTGTPSGCALSLPSPVLVKISGLLPEAIKWALFMKGQRSRPQYLKEGDLLESTILSSDGQINLGKQSHVIVGETMT